MLVKQLTGSTRSFLSLAVFFDLLVSFFYNKLSMVGFVSLPLVHFLLGVSCFVIDMVNSHGLLQYMAVLRGIVQGAESM